MEQEVNVNLHNRFDFVLRDAKTEEIINEYRAENIILDNFWPRYLSANTNTCLDYIHFGSGTATPLPTDVKLTSWLGYKKSSNVGEGVDFSNFESNGIASVLKTCRLQDTEFNDEYISEVGFSYSTSSTANLLTKALIRDMNGNVVSIEKQAGQILDIFATFFVDFGKNHYGGDVYYKSPNGWRFNWSSDDDAHILHRFLFSQSNKTDIYNRRRYYKYENTKNTSYYYAHSGVIISYDVGKKQMILTVPNLTAGVGNNLNGIKTINLLEELLIKVPNSIISQPIIEKEIVGVGDGTNRSFNTKFGWIKNNSTCRVYVNDVEVSATIRYNEPADRINTIMHVMNIVGKSSYNPYTKTPLPLIEFKATIDSLPNDVYITLENPYFLTHPITAIKCRGMNLKSSNNGTTWYEIGDFSPNTVSNINIPADRRNDRYWKFTTKNLYINLDTITSPTWEAASLITLNTAPAAGSVVSVRYQPDCLAKDEKHVLNDLSVTFTFNESSAY